MEIFSTIISGVVVFTVGQIIVKLMIDPVQKLKSTIANVAFTLHNEAIHYANPNISNRDDSSRTYENLRDIGSRLYADVSVIPWYSFCSKFFKLPRFMDVIDASNKLFSISNWQSSMSDEKNLRSQLLRTQICKHLGIPQKDGESEESLIEQIKDLQKSKKKG